MLGMGDVSHGIPGGGGAFLQEFPYAGRAPAFNGCRWWPAARCTCFAIPASTDDTTEGMNWPYHGALYHAEGGRL